MSKTEKNILFICSRNQWRSPTGEKVWRKEFGLQTRSAGTSPNAKKTISISDLQWADVIFVMEKKHKNRIQASFSQTIQYKELVVLDIPDEYKYMDPELVEIFRALAHEYIQKE
ncbi:MAG: phosphotyrosine protein phosphatase [Spirochaetota bacterium]